jgi:hypothetical protein
MNTTEIDRFVRDDDACRGIFQGVFSADTLPEKPRLLIGNTDPLHKPGNHWLRFSSILRDAENISIRSDANNSALFNAT